MGNLINIDFNKGVLTVPPVRVEGVQTVPSKGGTNCTTNNTYRKNTIGVQTVPLSGYTIIPDSIWDSDLLNREIRLLVRLIRWSSYKKTDKIPLANSQLMKDARISNKDTFKKTREKLRDLGLISFQVEPSDICKTENVYTLNKKNINLYFNCELFKLDKDKEKENKNKSARAAIDPTRSVKTPIIDKTRKKTSNNE